MLHWSTRPVSKWATEFVCNAFCLNPLALLVTGNSHLSSLGAEECECGAGYLRCLRTDEARLQPAASGH